MPQPTDRELIESWQDQPAPLLPLLHAFRLVIHRLGLVQIVRLLLFKPVWQLVAWPVVVPDGHAIGGRPGIQ